MDYSKGLSSEKELSQIEALAEEKIKSAQLKAWKAMRTPIDQEGERFLSLLADLEKGLGQNKDIDDIRREIAATPSSTKRHLASWAHKLLMKSSESSRSILDPLRKYYEELKRIHHHQFNVYTYNESSSSALKVSALAPRFEGRPLRLDGREVINRCFDNLLAKDPRLFILGEDVGQLGGVNLEFDGLSEKYGPLR